MAVIVRQYFQPGAPDPVLPNERVLAMVERCVPGADRVASVDESGGEARTYLVDTRVGDVVLKVQRPQQLRTWTSLAREVAFLDHLAGVDPSLPVPRVLGHGQDDDGVEYTVMTRVFGDAVLRAGLPDAARPAALQALGAVIRRVHEVPQAPLEASGLFPEEWSAADLRATLPEDVTDYASALAKREIPWPAPLTPAALGRWVADQVPDDPSRVALHTNPGPTHTFVDGSGRLTGLIDFGDAYVGPPVLDLSRWTRPRDRRALRDGYVAAGPTLPPAFWALWPVVEVLADLRGVLRRDAGAAGSAKHLTEVLGRA